MRPVLHAAKPSHVSVRAGISKGGSADNNIASLIRERKLLWLIIYIGNQIFNQTDYKKKVQNVKVIRGYNELGLVIISKMD